MAVKSLKREMTKARAGRADPSTCYKGQGFGECRWPSLGELLLHILIFLAANATILYYRPPPIQNVPSGNQWYEEVGDCPWWHHQFPLNLLQQIVEGQSSNSALKYCLNNVQTLSKYFWN